MAIGEISEPLNNSANSQYFLCGSKVITSEINPDIKRCVCVPITEGASWLRGRTAIGPCGDRTAPRGVSVAIHLLVSGQGLDEA